jgi:hypothetical protein
LYDIFRGMKSLARQAAHATKNCRDRNIRLAVHLIAVTTEQSTALPAGNVRRLTTGALWADVTGLMAVTNASPHPKNKSNFRQETFHGSPPPESG